MSVCEGVEVDAKAAAAAADGELKGDAVPSCTLLFCSTTSACLRSSGGRQSCLQIGQRGDLSVNHGSKWGKAKFYRLMNKLHIYNKVCCLDWSLILESHKTYLYNRYRIHDHKEELGYLPFQE
jgi:hypothetical protein